MAYELIFTSVPRGLKPGSRGFSTVAFTEGMPANYVQTCETLSGYTHAFQTHDPNYARNPIAFSHYRFRIGGQAFSILSRVAAYGTDYSERSNKLAHHIMVTDSECVAAGPAWTMTPADFFATEWQEEPHLIKTARRLREVAISGYRADHWRSMTGDAGWAGAIAQRYLDAPDKPVFLIFHPGQKLLPLVAEITSLLPEEKRWNFTYSTYFTAIPQGTDCFLRCCLPNAEGLRMSRRSPDALVLDLTAARAELAETGSLIEAARTGKMPVVTRPAAEKIAAAPVVQEVSSQPAKRESSKHQIRVSYAGTAPLAPVRQKRRPILPLAIAAAILVLVALGAIAVKVWPTIKVSLNKKNAAAPTKTVHNSESATKEIKVKPDVSLPQPMEENTLEAVKHTTPSVSNTPVQAASITNGTPPSGAHAENKLTESTETEPGGMFKGISVPRPSTTATNSQRTNTTSQVTTPVGKPYSMTIPLKDSETLSANRVAYFYHTDTKCSAYDINGIVQFDSVSLHKSHSFTGGGVYDIITNNFECTISKNRLELTPSQQTKWIHLHHSNTNLLVIVGPVSLTKIADERYTSSLPIFLLQQLPMPLKVKITAKMAGQTKAITYNIASVSGDRFAINLNAVDAYRKAKQDALQLDNRKKMEQELIACTNAADILTFIINGEGWQLNEIISKAIKDTTTMHDTKLRDALQKKHITDEEVKQLLTRKRGPRISGEEKKKCEKRIKELYDTLFDQFNGCKQGEKNKVNELLRFLDPSLQEIYKKDLSIRVGQLLQDKVSKIIDARAAIQELIISSKLEAGYCEVFYWHERSAEK